MHLCSTCIIKITVKKMAISSECFVYFRWDLLNWKEQSFNLTTGTEAITQLLKSNFEWSKCKWRHQCQAFAKKGTFSLNMSFWKNYSFWLQKVNSIKKLPTSKVESFLKSFWPKSNIQNSTCTKYLHLEL